MKKTTTLILLLFALFISDIGAQKVINQYDIHTEDMGEGKQYVYLRGRKDRPIDGKVRISKGYAEEYTDAFYKKGYPEGQWRSMKNKKLLEISNFKNGYLDGEQVTFNPSGKPQLKSFFDKGKKDATWIYYSFEGKPSQVEIYKNNLLESKKSFHPNGKLESEKEYKNGIEHGISKEFSDEGKLRGEYSYKEGRRIGKQIKILSSARGEYVEETNINERGLKDGNYLEIFLSDKSIKEKGRYVNGRKDGKWEYGHPIESRIYREENYEMGKMMNTIRF